MRSSLRKQILGGLAVTATWLAAERPAFGDCGCSIYDFGAYQPAYVPHINQLAFATTSNAYPPWFEFWEAIVAGPEFYYGRSGYVRHASWAPDENRIAFFSGFGIEIMQRGTETSMPLAGQFGDSDPA
jgi:hypothetical protein